MEASDILSYLGYNADQFTTIDEFKDTFSGDYGKMAALKKNKTFVGEVTGKALGSITTKAVTMFKEMGVEIDKDDAEKNPVEHTIKVGLTKLQELHSGAMDEVKAKSGQKESDALKELNSKLEAATKERSQIEQMLATTKKEHEDYTKKKDQEVVGMLRDHEYSRQFGQFKFKPEADTLVKRGFEAELNSRYSFDYDTETKDLIPTDKKTGEKIPNPDKNSTFKSFTEVINDLGDELNVRDNNQHTRRPAGTKGTPPAAPGNKGQGYFEPPPPGDGKELTGDGKFRVRRTQTNPPA